MHIGIVLESDDPSRISVKLMLTKNFGHSVMVKLLEADFNKI